MKCMQKHSWYVGEPNNNQSESEKYPDQSPPQSKYINKIKKIK